MLRAADRDFRLVVIEQKVKVQVLIFRAALIGIVEATALVLALVEARKSEIDLEVGITILAQLRY